MTEGYYFYSSYANYTNKKYNVYRNFGFNVNSIKYNTDKEDNIPVVSSFIYNGTRYVNTHSTNNLKHFGYLNRDLFYLLKEKQEKGIHVSLEEFKTLKFFSPDVIRKFNIYKAISGDIIN